MIVLRGRKLARRVSGTLSWGRGSLRRRDRGRRLELRGQEDHDEGQRDFHGTDQIVHEQDT
jgi:hypothetical protein